MSLIALEEHYAWDPVSANNVVGNWLRENNTTAYERLYDRGDLRLEQMDAAGIDFQIMSLFDPGVQDETDVGRAVDLARRANDDLAQTVRAKPQRLGGFATLATQDPDAAAAELHRAVSELGLVGGLINGHCQGRYLDDPAYFGLFECAQGGDTSGRVRKLERLPSEYLRTNFHVTTSGNFCPPAFACTLEVIGADRVMFSVDYPMDDNKAGADFLAAYPMDESVRRQVGSENARHLFGDRIPAQNRA